LLAITRQVKVAEKANPETLVLKSESQKRAIEQAGVAQAKSQAEVNGLVTSNEEVNAKNRELEAESLSSRKLELAKSLFSTDEAEVFRDSDKLVIRMKNLAFPSGSSTLAPRNFAQLAKVQSVMRDLGEAHITIEGHTDTVGNQRNNQILSDRRARVISDYFVANGIDKDDISTIGYGASRPIAPNTLKEGRSQNRRVDVIIDPK
jgi:outer membrane protein OmpA-like peptidoglycan-associated protein